MRLKFPQFAREGTKHRLDPAKIVETAENLSRELGERLPGSTLAVLSGELVILARTTEGRVREARKPIYAIRAVSYLAIGTTVLFLGLIAHHIHTRWAFSSVTDLFEATDAGFNLLAILGGTLWFFGSFESRIKRRRALASIEELRDFIHVIDINQLYYTPHLYGQIAIESLKEQKLDFTYILYCTQLVALIGNLAPLHTRGAAGDSILRAVSDVEQLANAVVSKLQAKADSVRMIANLPRTILHHAGT